MGLRSILPKIEHKTGWPWTEETDPAIYDPGITYPRITIVTASYNQGQYIEETIRSILLQNYPNLEYIIIDGGSTDNSVDIIKQYAPWITYWVSEKDRGQSHAINKGFEKATGDIVNWINSDDILRKDVLAFIERAMREEEVYCLCGNAYIDFMTPGKTNDLFKTSLLDQDLNTHLANCSFSQPATFFKGFAFRQITPLEESLHMNMDMFMWYRFICLYGLEKVRATDEILCEVKSHLDAKTVKSFKKSFIDKERIYQSLFKSLNPEFKNQVELFELKISDGIREKINYKKLRMRYFRTHLYHAELDGTVKGVKWNHLIKFFFMYVKGKLTGTN